MTVALSMFAGVGAQFFTDDGVPLAGGLIYSYEAGTTTPTATYIDSSGLTANSNPIVLDAAGRVPYQIWLTVGNSCKFMLCDSTDVEIRTYDNVYSAAASGVVSSTVGALPIATSVAVGTRLFVTDSSVTTFGSAVASGGANKVPVYSTGTAWLVG